MSEDPKSSGEVDDLIRRHLDGRLSDAEFHEFEARLVSDPEFRQRYIILSDLEASLWDQPYSVAPQPNKVVPRKRPLQYIVAVATLLSLAVATYFAISNEQGADNQDGKTPIVKKEVDDSESEAIVPNPDAAVVTYADTQIKGITVGQRLKQGVVKVDEGKLQLEFMCGAHVSIFGPAELVVESPASATLKFGRAAANVPERARGFVLNSPTAAVYDLGTEFSVSVDDTGESEVAVLSGEVELSLLGDDGNTRTSRRVSKDEVFRVAEGGQISESESTSQGEEFRVESPSIQPLVVPGGYDAMVIKSSPSDYWRFSESELGLVANEIDGGTPLQVVAPEEQITVKDGSVFLSRSGEIRHLVSEVPLRGINQSDFSVEMWINPSDLTHSTCGGLFPAEDPKAAVHLSVLEVVTATFMKHEPGAFRFLYRSPPGSQPTNSVNAFSAGVMTPGLWHHIAAVRGSEEMRLYLNGRVVRSAAVNLQNDDQDFHFILGQLRPGTTERQYAGAIDEVAIYRRPLTEEEVWARYSIIAESNADSVSALR